MILERTKECSAPVLKEIRLEEERIIFVLSLLALAADLTPLPEMARKTSVLEYYPVARESFLQFRPFSSAASGFQKTGTRACYVIKPAVHSIRRFKRILCHLNFKDCTSQIRRKSCCHPVTSIYVTS